jgi:hypothetical protein
VLWVVVVVVVCEFPACELPVDGVVVDWPVLTVEFVLPGDVVLWATTQVAHSRRTDNKVVCAFIMLEPPRINDSCIEVTVSVSDLAGPSGYRLESLLGGGFSRSRQAADRRALVDRLESGCVRLALP